MATLELILAACVFGPPLISIVNSRGNPNDAYAPIFSFIGSIGVAFIVGWLTSLLVPLYLPALTGLVAYLYTYYKIDDNFRDAVSGGKIDDDICSTKCNHSQNDVSVGDNLPPVQKDSGSNVWIWIIIIFLICMAVLYVTGKQVGTVR